MIAKTLLRDIREERKKIMSDHGDLPEGMLTIEQYKQFLIVDPPFKIDIVSLMEIWGEKYRKDQERKNTAFVDVKNQWINAIKDPDQRKNRRNGIQSLINSRILQTSFENGIGMSVYQFTQNNSLHWIKELISMTPNQADLTKKTYQVLYGSLWKYMWKFINESSCKPYKKLKPLKKGIRTLELSETAFIYDELEMKAMKSIAGLRDLLIMRLILYAGEGIEIKSIFALKREDINFFDNVVKIKIRHTNKTKQVKCSPNFMSLLRSYLGRRKQFIFENVQQDHLNKRLERIRAKFGILDITLKNIQRTLIYLVKGHGLI